MPSDVLQHTHTKETSSFWHTAFFFIKNTHTQENVVCLCTHTHTGMLFNLKKDRNPVICNNMNETEGHYAK